MFSYYQLFVTLAALYILLTTFYNLHYMIRLPSDASLPPHLPLVSVLVPARDEERNIRACLESLLQQDYPNLEIIVLDDDSSDATPEIVQQIAQKHQHVRLVRGEPLPLDWHGKAWACHQLAQHAQGEWLLFVDADTRHHPKAVSSALAVAWSHRLDLLSLLPDMALKTFGTRVLMSIIPFVFVGCLPHFVFTKTHSPFLATALGPFMLFRAKVYHRFGGHEAVRQDIAEDVFISRWVKRVGGRIAVADGASVLRVEFYRNAREAWHGLAKSAFPALNYSLPKLILAIGLFSTLMLSPYLCLYGAWRDGITDMLHFGLPVIQLLLIWTATGLIYHRYYIPSRYALLSGLTVVAAILFCLDSVARSLFGAGVAWKGRTYQFRG